MFNKIDQAILIDEDIKNNFMGLATDDGKNMTGTNTDLAKHLKDKYSRSHAFNNVLKKSKGYQRMFWKVEAWSKRKTD